MNSEVQMLLLHAETPMHPGSGSALGTVDLPVARERHTKFPFIPGSSMKGVLRDVCRALNEDNKLSLVFGPDTSEHAGALSITDARLLLFPLRSLSGLFAWTTCPAVLERFVRDARVGISGELIDAAQALQRAASQLPDNTAMVSKSSDLKSRDRVVFEEFDYHAQESDSVGRFGRAIAGCLGDDFSRVGTHIAVISDNAFSHSTQFATEVMARIKLHPETKTVDGGALFYEEFIPAGAVFYSLAFANEPRAKKEERNGFASAGQVMGFLRDGIKSEVIQVGANATTGKGICTVKLTGGAK